MDREWFFYIVRCKDNTLYSGITVNVDERVKKHNKGTGAKYTAAHRPVILVYSEKCGTASVAMKREKQVKRLPKIKKERLARSAVKMDTKVKEYIDRQKSPQKEICLQLRELILKTYPTAREEIKWGVPAYDGGRFYLGAMKKQVNMGVSTRGLAKDQIALFEGTGKTMRHIKIRTTADIKAKKIIKLLKIAGKCAEDC
jgi:putative endonuclease